MKKARVIIIAIWTPMCQNGPQYDTGIFLKKEMNKLYTLIEVLDCPMNEDAWTNYPQSKYIMNVIQWQICMGSYTFKKI